MSDASRLVEASVRALAHIAEQLHDVADRVSDVVERGQPVSRVLELHFKALAELVNAEMFTVFTRLRDVELIEDESL